jgi:hypothetical protein
LFRISGIRICEEDRSLQLQRCSSCCFRRHWAHVIYNSFQKNFYWSFYFYSALSNSKKKKWTAWSWSAPSRGRIVRLAEFSIYGLRECYLEWCVTADRWSSISETRTEPAVGLKRYFCRTTRLSGRQWARQSWSLTWLYTSLLAYCSKFD